MLMLIKSQLRSMWWVLTGAIAIVSLVPGLTLHDPYLTSLINRDWAHFLAYAAAGAITLLAWRVPTGIAISLGMSMLSFGLQVLRGMASGQRTDREGAVINLLGLAAGVLIGLHIHRFGSDTKRQLASDNVHSAPAGHGSAHLLKGGESISAPDSTVWRGKSPGPKHTALQAATEAIGTD
jgi:hypothetical protein